MKDGDGMLLSFFTLAVRKDHLPSCVLSCQVNWQMKKRRNLPCDWVSRDVSMDEETRQVGLAEAKQVSACICKEQHEPESDGTPGSNLG